MTKSNIQYLTSNDSRVVASGKLWVGQEDIALSSVNFAEYRDVQRKVIISWSSGANPVSYGAALKSKNISENNFTFEILDPGSVKIEFGSEKFLIENNLIPLGNYSLSVDVYLDFPLKAGFGVPENIKPILHYSEVIIVVMRLEKIEYFPQAKISEKRPVYDTYGNLGFFIADLEKMNSFVVARLGEGVINLKDAFCETEIANELFEAGLLILVWGITPWTYYFYGLDSKKELDLVPSLDDPQFSGTYRFSASITDPSIAPGDFLLDWPDCLNREFPKVSLRGDGQWVNVDIHVMGYYMSGAGAGPIFAVVTAYRSEGDAVSNLLLSADIESVDQKLFF